MAAWFAEERVKVLIPDMPDMPSVNTDLNLGSLKKRAQIQLAISDQF